MVDGSARAPALPALALVFNALVWGVSWWPLRALQGHGLHPLWSTVIVYLLCLAAVLAARPRALAGFAGQPLIWLLLAASGLTNMGFNWAVTVGDVVRVVLLFYLMPAWTVLLAWPLLGEKPTLGSLARMGLALAGVVIVLKTPEAPWPLPQDSADWLALLGGFSFALTNILLRKLQDVPPASRVLAMFGGGTLMAGAAALLGMAQGYAAAPPAPTPAWAGVALALGVAFLLGNLALQYGASRLNAHTSALIMLTEVLFASASSVALGAAQLTSRTWVGGALIVAAAVWSAWPAQSRDDGGGKVAGAQSAP